MCSQPQQCPSARQKRRRLFAWAALLLLSAVLHLGWLGRRTLHHDEAVHAWFADRLAADRIYKYDPTYHGPLLYFATAACFIVVPESVVANRELVCRLPIALAGVAMVVVAWGSRRIFGDAAAWWMGLLFTVSPVFLFFGRFLRMDLLEVLTASCALVAWHALLRGGPHAWLALGLAAGCAVATKENAYVTLALVAMAAAVLGVLRGLRGSVHVAAGWLQRRWLELVLAGLTLVVVTVPLYTAFFSHPEDLLYPVRAIRFWWIQHLEQRVAGPCWYYLPRLVQYELLILVAATVWVVRRRRCLRDVEIFLFLLGVGSLGMYGYLGEKVPWLLVHQVWPFVPLAGSQLAWTFGPDGRWWSRLLAAAGLGITVTASLVCSFVLDEISPAQERVESLHYVQTCPEMKTVISDGVQLREADGQATIYVTGAGAWPLHWYWRDLAVRWSEPPAAAGPSLVVCNLHDADRIADRLAGAYSRQKVPLRAWWLMEERRPSVLEVLRYLLFREPWGRIGSADVVVLRKLPEEEASEVVYRSTSEPVALRFEPVPRRSR